MFDKIGIVLKDFIIYLIPGLLICYLGLLLWNPEIQLISEVQTNICLTAIALVIAFVVGFICTQIQLMVANAFKGSDLWALNTLNLQENIKMHVVYKVNKLLKVDHEILPETVLHDNELVHFCFYYIKSNANGDAINVVERDSYLASFAISIYLPINLCFIVLLKALKMDLWQTMGFEVVFLAISFWLIRKIVVSFEKKWAEKIFYLFINTNK